MKLNTFLGKLYLITVSVLATTPTLVWAAPGTGRYQPVSAAPTFAMYPDGGPLSLQNVIDIATEIRNAFMIIAIVVIVVFLIWGALRLIFASGNAEAAASARGMIFTVVLGALIVLATFPLIRTLQGVLNERTLFFGSVGEIIQQSTPAATPQAVPRTEPFDP